MARHLIGTVRLKVDTLQNVGKTITYSDGDFFEIFYNDSTDGIEGDLNGSSTSDGPVIQINREGIEHTFVALNYAQCHPSITNTYLQFLPRPIVSIMIYPYFVKVEEANSSRCSGGSTTPITISNTTVSDETAIGAADGSVTVTATGGGQTLKYSAGDFNYSIAGQTSNVVSGLVKGSHTIYVKDGLGQTERVTVEVGRTGETDLTVYTDLYRIPYITSNGDDSRITIGDRDFTGSVTTLEKSAKAPFQLTYQGENNIFNPVIGSKAAIGLVSQSNFQFIDLFTQDDKRYYVKWEKDTGSGYETRWTGFIQADFFQEPYQEIPYDTTIFATDGLGKLSQVEFLREDGQKYQGSLSCLEVLLLCLNKIGLQQGVREAINMYEDSFNTAATDSPLAQTYVNTESYYTEEDPLNCLDVIKRILEPFGATLFNANGFWYIVRNEEFKDSSIAYRQFTSQGVYESNSTFSPVVDFKAAHETDRAAALRRGATLNVTPANGTVKIISNLLKSPTSLQGDFTEPNLVGQFNIFAGFPGWTFSPGLDPGATSRDFEVRDENSNWWILESGGGSTGSAFIITPFLNMDFSQSDRIRFKFKYFVSAKDNFFGQQIVTPPYARLKWRYLVGQSESGSKSYLRSDGTWSSSQVENIIFVEEFNKELEFEIEAQLIEDTSIFQGVHQAKLFLVGFKDTDDPDLTDEADVISTLKAIDTTSLNGGYRYSLGIDNAGAVTNYYYVLTERSDDNITGSDEPGLVIPTDYADNTNEKIWQIEQGGKVTAANQIFPETKFSLVDAEFLPASRPCPSTSTISAETQGLPRKIERVQEVELYHFDAPPEINNSRNIYINHFLTSSGVQTNQWTRDSEPGELRTIQNILAIVYVEQTRFPRKKITINFKGKEISMLNVIRDTFDSNILYMIRGLSINDKEDTFSVSEMVQIADGEDLGAYSSAYSSAYGGEFNSVLT